MLNRILFWTLFPLVLPQALRVRRAAPRFEPARGPREGSIGEGPPLSLIAVGDSIVAGVGADRLEQALVGRSAAALAAALGRRVDWTARGRNGADCATVIERLLPRLPPVPADVILVSVGVNDVTSLARTGRWRDGVLHLIGELRSHSPDAVIALAGLPPLEGFPLLPSPLAALFGLRRRTFDAVLRGIAADRAGVVHVAADFDPAPERFAADGFHPSEASYAKYGERVCEAVRPLLTARERSVGAGVDDRLDPAERRDRG